MKHYSINAASEILERQRKTITRALRHVPPDSHERGQPRWTMANIVRAVSENADKPAAQQRGNVDALESDFQLLSKRYEAEFKKLETLPLAKRRPSVTALIEFIVGEFLPAYRARDAASDLHPDHVLLRHDQLRRVVAGALRFLCNWDHETIFGKFLDAEEVED